MKFGLSAYFFAFAMAAILSFTGPTAAQSVNSKLHRSEMSIPFRYIVVLEPWAVADTDGGNRPEQVSREMSGKYGGKVKQVFRHALNGYTAQMTPTQAEALSRDPRVKFVEEDSVVYADSAQNNATWGLDRVDQRELPLNSIYDQNASGSGVRVYILDSGILASHVEFQGRVAPGYSSMYDGYGYTDCYGHGTHVAGTVGGVTWGIAKNVTLVPVRVLGCNGSGSVGTAVEGIEWVTAQKRANPSQPSVANMSLSAGASSAMDSALATSVNAGVVYVVAAGNNNADACSYSPSRAPSAITVGATGSNDARASYSNYGSCVNIFAPGTAVTSAHIGSTTATATMSGTSMASPHVAGAAALYLEGNPYASPSAVRQALIGNGTSGKVTNAGPGSPDSLLYTTFSAAGDPAPGQAPTANFSFACSGLSCQFSDSSVDDLGVATWSWSFGDGSTSSARNPSKAYAAAGTYTVVLTVSDWSGLSGTATRTVTVTQPSGIQLSVRGYKLQGTKRADLTWSGAAAPTMDIYRNNSRIATSVNDGAHTDNTGQRGGGTYTYRVCEAGTNTCSASVSVTF